MKNGRYTGKKLGNSSIKYAWFKYDQYHREDGPAIEYNNGDKYWYVNGKCHRADGPAVEWRNVVKKWFINNKCHRLDGPAIEGVDGTKYWYYYGEQIDCQSQEEFDRIIKLLAFS